MKNNIEQTEDIEQVSDDYFDFMLIRALDEISEENGEKYEKELEEVSNPNYSEKYKKNINKFFKDRYYKTKAKRNLLKIASIICICIVSSLYIAYETNANFRFFINKTISNKETHIDIDIITSDLNYDFNNIPDSWEHFYIPKYIPEGYVFSSIEANRIQIIMQYIKDEDTIIFTQTNTVDISLSLDIEHSSINDITIDSYDAYLTINDNYTKIYWNNRSYSFSLSGTINQEELIGIAESIEMIKR